jgi:hypothetical protein
MFKVAGIKEILSNVVKLTKSHFDGAPNKKTLQRAYYSFLKSAQPKVPKPASIFRLSGRKKKLLLF